MSTTVESAMAPTPGAGGEGRAENQGEKWTPSTEIEKGSVAKFQQMFGPTGKPSAAPANANAANSSPSHSPKSGPVYNPADGGRRKWATVKTDTTSARGTRGTLSTSLPPMPTIETEGQDHAMEKEDQQKNGEKWNPQTEIDADRVDNIKAMWGAKAGGSVSRSSKAVGVSDGPAQPEAGKVVSSGPTSMGLGPKAGPASPASGGLKTPPKKDMNKNARKIKNGADEINSVIGNLKKVERDDSDDESITEELERLRHSYDPECPLTPDDKKAMRAEIDELVKEVMPDEVDHIDDLLEQFQGREDKLRDALRGMKTKIAEEEAAAKALENKVQSPAYIALKEAKKQQQQQQSPSKVQDATDSHAAVEPSLSRCSRRAWAGT